MWLKAGDKNNKYFHSIASIRRRTNQIHKLKNVRYESGERDYGLQELITGYYTYLYTSDRPMQDKVIENIHSTITVDQNVDLVRPVTGEEVKKGLFQMHIDKARGPDEMTPVFFQKN